MSNKQVSESFMETEKRNISRHCCKMTSPNRGKEKDKSKHHSSRAMIIKTKLSVSSDGVSGVRMHRNPALNNTLNPIK